jgi:hypothetical protein
MPLDTLSHLHCRPVGVPRPCHEVDADIFVSQGLSLLSGFLLWGQVLDYQFSTEIASSDDASDEGGDRSFLPVVPGSEGRW